MPENQSEFFQKTSINLNPHHILAFFSVYNEIERLPYFLKYYRDLGVDYFFAIDNASNDGTKEFLIQQDDVIYFYTDSSYAESKAGRLWTHELYQFYGENHWCLTLDVDELLVFPGVEYITITELCSFLDRSNFEGLFTVFLDMYSDKNLCDTRYVPGTPFLDICRYFEDFSYELNHPKYFPPVQIFGGPRQRIFWKKGNEGKGPSMRKMPLVKWREDFKYNFSTHSSVPVRIANFTGALLHFKFFASFEQLVVREVLRGDRAQPQDYRRYASVVEEDTICFYEPTQSIFYQDSSTLIERGLIVTEEKYVNFVCNRAKVKYGEDIVKKLREKFLKARETAEENSRVSVRQLPKLWPMLSKDWHKSSSIKSIGQDRNIENLENLLLEGSIKLCIQGELIYINEQYILGWVWNRVQPSLSLTVQLHNHGKYIASLVAQDHLDTYYHPAIKRRNIAFKFRTPTELLNSQNNQIELFIFPGRISLTDSPIQFDGSCQIQQSTYDGVCERVRDGYARGWVWDKNQPYERIELSIYMDDILLFNLLAENYRKDLEKQNKGDGCHGFFFKIPNCFFDGNEHKLYIRITNTGFNLRKTPILVSNGEFTLFQ